MSREWRPDGQWRPQRLTLGSRRDIKDRNLVLDRFNRRYWRCHKGSRFGRAMSDFLFNFFYSVLNNLAGRWSRIGVYGDPKNLLDLDRHILVNGAGMRLLFRDA